MKRFKPIIAVFLCLVLCSCTTNTIAPPEPFPTLISTNRPSASYQKITAEEARGFMDSGEEYILLDVRTDQEFNEGHIGGAMLIPDYEIAVRAEQELPDKNALILIYCRSGRRSANIANELLEMGYLRVYDFGGIIDWPYETSAAVAVATPRPLAPA